MRFRFCPLASGSKGNTLFLECGETKLLIDCGISTRKIEERLSEIGVGLDEIQGILITHEHTDHISALDVLGGKYNIPIFTNADTAKGILSIVKRRPAFKIFSTGENFQVGEFEIHPFSIQHDTLDPVAFTLRARGKKLGICADLGFATSLVRAQLKECDLLYLEFNHEVSMVHSSNRPMIYKQRVLGRQGHLSNDDAAALLRELSHDNLKKVYLAHLSEECNHPEVALRKAQQALIGYSAEVVIAHQHRCSEVFGIREGE